MHIKESERRGIAEKIALDAGVLKKCPYHEEIIDAMNGDDTPAHQLAERLFAKGEIDGFFDSLEQVHGEIDAAIDDAGAKCYICEKLRDPD